MKPTNRSPAVNPRLWIVAAVLILIAMLARAATPGLNTPPPPLDTPGPGPRGCDFP